MSSVRTKALDTGTGAGLLRPVRGRHRAGVSPSAGTPVITLNTGEFYFRDGGTPSLLLGTNPTGWLTTQFETLLRQASANERIVRIHLTNGRRPQPATAGDVDCAWAQFWDEVFLIAEQHGLYVLPVFDVWADWNTTNAGTQTWANNVYNVVNGGPATDPEELLQSGTTQDLWLNWLQTLVLRWEGRPNILGWEVFSELNLISNANEASAVSFVEAAAAIVRAADSRGRPVTASLAGINDWPTLSTSSIDFIQVHPYADFPPYCGDLDDLILNTVRTRRILYGKPVFIGESGLEAQLGSPGVNCTGTSRTLDPEAPIGINQAIWAGAVSGAMTGRMLWFEDGYDVYHVDDNGDPLDLRTAYADAAAPVAAFLAGVDYSGFEPITLAVGADLIGATLGNNDLVLGWVRDVLSAAPDWPTRVLIGETVTVSLPGQWEDWLVDFYATDTGAVVSSVFADQNAAGDLTVTLPDFEGSFAFQLRGLPALDVLIDIRPRGRRNRINPNARGAVFVVILTTSVAAGEPLDFDASFVTPSSVRFGPGAALALGSRLVDLGRDGDLDLLLAFRKQDTGLMCGDTTAVLTGETYEGRAIVGSDSVIATGCPP